jgi:hypothetical protein
MRLMMDRLRLAVVVEGTVFPLHRMVFEAPGVPREFQYWA